MLPTLEQILRAKTHMQWGAERALIAYYCHTPSLADLHKVECIKELKEAAEALGYELVERVPKTDGGPLKVAVDEKQFLAAVDCDGDVEVGAGTPFASGGLINPKVYHLVGENANDRAEAIPASPGGGRMDLPEVSDA